MVGRGIGGIRESGDRQNKGENGGKRRYYRRIPTKPAGGLLSDIGNGGPCLWLTGHAIPDCPEVV